MIALEDLQPTQREFKIREIWKYLLWSNYSVASVVLLVFCFLIKDPKFNSAVIFMLIFGFVVAWICFACAYRSPGVWLLRISALGLCCQVAKAFFDMAIYIYVLVFAKFNDAQSFLIWGIVLMLFFLTLMSAVVLYTSYRLIYINKKIQCTKYLNQEELNEMALLKSSNDPTERAAIYNKLTTRNAIMHWIFKRIWKNKKVLISRW